MAKPGRKPLLEPTTEWKLHIPVSIAAKADLLHLDPVRGVPRYGARSALVIKLLRDHLTSLGEKREDTVPNGDINNPINLPEN